MQILKAILDVGLAVIAAPFCLVGRFLRRRSKARRVNRALKDAQAMLNGDSGRSQ